jgi:hypothetical protein
MKNGLPMLTKELAAVGRAQTAGRIGARQGKVSELTVFLPFVKGSEAASRPAAVTGRELPGGGRGRHGPRHALRVRGQRHEVALRDGL